MHAAQAFSFERALRITAPEDPHVNQYGMAFRQGQVLRLDETSVDQAADSCYSVQLGSPSPATRLRRLSALDTLVLRRPAHSVLDGRIGLLMTYVLRHSPAGLRWRDSKGEASRLQPGELFISQSTHDTLVELSPSAFDAPCECVRVMFRTDIAADMAVHVDSQDFPICGCSDADIRVILGRYRDHAAHLSPVPNLNVLDVELAPISELEVPVAPDHWALALVTAGSLQHQGALIESTTAVAFLGEAPLARLATQTGASLLWFDVPYAMPFPAL